MMTLLFVLFILVQQLARLQAQPAGCIRNYGELKNSILNNTENVEDLLLGFYPPNQSPAHIITVYYYILPLDFGDNSTSIYSDDALNSTAANYTFQWVDSSTLLLTEWKLFSALSFDIAELVEYNISLIVSPAFCNTVEAVKLLNMATIWLKSYAVGSTEKEHYYSLYFDEDQFIVLGNDVHGTTSALILCEYLAAFGSMVAFYVLLLLTRFKAFRRVAEILSDISTSCFALMLVIIVKDIISYSQAYAKSTYAWFYAFPLPVVFPAWSVINLILSFLAVVFIGKEFPLPGLLSSIYNYCCLKNNLMKSLLQVILIFSISSVALLIAFHFIWILLAVSAYPVRSIASQAFIIPLLSTILTIFYLIDTVAKSPGVLRQAETRLRKIGIGVVLSLMSFPIVIGLFGVLYYYSQALSKVNETENNPIKTVIAGLAPTLMAGFLAWTARRAISYMDISGNTEATVTSSSTGKKRKSKMKSNIATKEEPEINLQSSPTEELDKAHSDDELLPLV